MRKIDAVLLSALIVYDYSAQSLVDSDAINLGQSFSSTSISDNKLTATDNFFVPDFTETNDVVRGAKKINPDNNVAAVDNNTISFHELAKVNPVTASIVSNSIDAENATVSISIPSPSDEAITAPEAFSTTTESVEVNNANYSEAVTNNEEITEQVTAVADMSTFDEDNDGVYNAEDNCPGIAGVARFEGCPVPDSDADGINDEEDRCAFEKGSADNFGCPVSAEETVLPESTVSNNDAVYQNDSEFKFTVHFNADNKILSSEDFNIVLQLTDILVRTPDAKVEIENTANGNPSSPQSPVDLLKHYFIDLGVAQSQIIIKEQEKEATTVVANGNSKVKMRINL